MRSTLHWKSQKVIEMGWACRIQFGSTRTLPRAESQRLVSVHAVLLTTENNDLIAVLFLLLLEETS